MIDEYYEAQSLYVPYLSFKGKAHEILNEKYILPLIKIFFDTKRIVNYQPLDKNKVISDKDFCNTKFIDITYFYDYIVGDISKDENGKIQHIIRYAITFDKAMTPKDENGISYGEIKLGNNPIFYFIYVDLQDMLNFLKKNNE